MRELGLSAEVRFAAYNQVFQELLDPGGLLARNISGVNVVLVRFDDWPAGQSAGFVDAVRAAAGRMAVPLIVVLCPGAAQCDDEVRHGVAGLPSVYLLTAARIAALYPVAEVHDPAGDQLGRVPYTPLYFVALATALARQIHAIHAPPFKAIALDCDDTLWAGICGEDGPEGVVLDPPRRALQEFMAERRREGMLLGLCSKNNEEAVGPTFRWRPAISWRGASTGIPKSATLPPSPKSWISASTPSSWSTTIPRRCGRCRPGFPRCWRCSCPRAPRRSPLSWPTSGPSTAPASPRRTAPAERCTPTGRRGRAPRVPPPASRISWRRSLSMSGSRPWSPPRWTAWRSSPSAPTR